MKGVYVIECLVNGKRYVGCSNDVEKRIAQQKYNLTNKEYNKKLVNRLLYLDVQKFGWGKFKVTTKELPDGKELKDFEFEIMTECNSVHPNGYNLRRDYKGNHITHEETVKLMRVSNKGSKNPNYGNHWTKEQKDRMSSIKKEQHASGEIYGKEWRDKQGENTKKFWKDNPDIKKQMAEKVSKAKQKYRVIKCDMDGNEIKKYETMKDAVADNEGFRDIGIYNACNGYRPSYRGYKWKRELKI